MFCSCFSFLANFLEEFSDSRLYQFLTGTIVIEHVDVGVQWRVLSEGQSDWGGWGWLPGEGGP